MFNLSDKSRKFLAKNANRKIVFTNGCFDILHAGHITYLNQAKQLGDLLFVGLNSDKSISQLKGADRPINHQADRQLILENLKAVDCVEIFDEETPLNLIVTIKPNILVKGGDWKVEQIVGSAEVIKSGGVVRSLSFKDGYSTTEVIEKIRASIK